mmetsp:Transcript_3521/g.8436  ORF Transcript_3521/g.8436 Transcript_3521/m.8436 type:complete len:156 (+) Transcript_3521:411-878(+)
MNDAFTSYLLRKFAREETLSLSVEMFVPDIFQRRFLEAARKKYQGICHADKLIVKVEEVLRIDKHCALRNFSRQVTGVVDMQVNCLVLHISKGDKLEFFEHAFQRGQFELTHLSKHLRMIVPASNRKETKPHLSVDTALYTKGTPYISILARFVA